MINDIKLGFRMLRYAHGLKGNVVCCALLMIFGVIIMVFSREVSGMGGYAGFLIMIVGMFPTQLIFSTNMTDLVQSAPAGKRMQTRVPVLCSLVSMALLFTMIALMRGVMVCNDPILLQAACNELVVIAILGAVVTLYIALAYKKFWLGTIMFLLFSGLFVMTDEKILNLSIFGPEVSSFLLAWVLGLVILVVASALAYGVSLLVYKLPVSKMSQPATLRKYL